MTIIRTIRKTSENGNNLGQKNGHMRKMALVLALMSSIAGTAFADSMTQTADGSEVKVVAIQNTAIRPSITIESEQVVIAGGKQLSFNEEGRPILSKDQELMLPAGQVMTGMGYKIKWDAKKHSMTIVTERGVYVYRIGDTRFIKEKTAYQGLYEAELRGENDDAYPIFIRNGRILVPVRFFENMRETVVIRDTLSRLILDGNRHAPEGASTLGMIEEIIPGKDGIQVLVNGSAYGKMGHDRISLSVPMGTVIRLSSGQVLQSSDLKVGDQILATYGPAVTKSLPPIGKAISIEVIQDEGLFEGKVYDITSKDEKYGITRMRVVGTQDYILGIDSKTTIQDADGRKVEIKDIKLGSIIKVYTAPYAALSYPAQTLAYRIQIVSAE